MRMLSQQHQINKQQREVEKLETNESQIHVNNFITQPLSVASFSTGWFNLMQKRKFLVFMHLCT